jgi:hypothetical protein
MFRYEAACRVSSGVEKAGIALLVWSFDLSDNSERGDTLGCFIDITVLLFSSMSFYEDRKTYFLDDVR